MGLNKKKHYLYKEMRMWYGKLIHGWIISNIDDYGYYESIHFHDKKEAELYWLSHGGTLNAK